MNDEKNQDVILFVMKYHFSFLWYPIGTSGSLNPLNAFFKPATLAEGELQCISVQLTLDEVQKYAGRKKMVL